MYYLVYPGSEKLDLGPRRPITITRNKDTAYWDRAKYTQFGEVVEVETLSDLIKILNDEDF